MTATGAPLADLEAFATGATAPDPYPIFARLREQAPVVWSDVLQAWLVTRWVDVTRCFKDSASFGPLAAGAGSSAIYGRTILHMTGDEHRRKAAIVARRIRNRRELRGSLRDRVTGLVEALAADLPVAPEPVDVRAALTTPLPLTVIAELMSMHDAVRFPQWYHDLAGASVSNVARDPAVHARGVRAKAEIDAWLDPAIAAKRAAPTDDLLADLCTLEYEGQRLADAEVMSNTAFFLADTFDVGRFAGSADPQFTRVGPLRAFGGGEHTCTGSLLAKLEIEEVLEHLLANVRRLEVAGEPPPDRGFVLRSAPELHLLLHT